MVLPAGLFEGALEEVAGFGCFEVRSALIATDRDQVIVIEVPVTLEAARHEESLDRLLGNRCSTNVGAPPSPQCYRG